MTGGADQRGAPIFGAAGPIGVIVPANTGVLEPELWSRAPAGVAVYATRMLARGDLTADAVRTMEREVDRAVDELCATGVDVLLIADMVTTFIMEEGWNESRTSGVAERTGVPCVSAWTALVAAMRALGVRRLALGTPYPPPRTTKGTSISSARRTHWTASSRPFVKSTYRLVSMAILTATGPRRSGPAP
jgi:maleate cis-trans isomerase